VVVVTVVMMMIVVMVVIMMTMPKSNDNLAVSRQRNSRQSDNRHQSEQPTTQT
jgi:preprotein translocase subunit SecG